MLTWWGVADVVKNSFGHNRLGQNSESDTAFG